MKNGVILIHGFTATPKSFGELPEILKKQNFCISTPALPGHCTNWENLINTNYEEWIECVKNEYLNLKDRVDNIYVIGLSMGGILASIISESGQPEIKRAVLISTPFIPKFHEKMGYHALKPFLKKVKGIGGDIKKPGVVEKTYDYVPVAAVGELIKLMKLGKNLLNKINIPVLAFYSKNDHIISKKNWAIVKKNIRNLEFNLLENSYHVSTLDNDAPLIYEKIIEFLKN